MLNLWLNGEQETIENWQVQMELIKICYHNTRSVYPKL